MKLIDIDYFAFLERLKAAGHRGERIEAKDKARWSAYVRENRILDAAFMVYAKSASPTVIPVIIDSRDRWNGFYAHSKQDSICLKFDRGD